MTDTAIRELGTLFSVGVTGSLTDGQLLARFVERREEAVFEAIVARHGPMVWGVCRRVLRDHHDAEDAFQATFFVLARRSASIARPERLGNWLYGVARQTAMKARAMRVKRSRREGTMPDVTEPMATQDNHRDDLAESLDRELGRLPEKYRLPIVLCDLEGRTHQEAATQLGWPIGTVSGRLSRARVMLAGRLARRGVTPTIGTLAILLARESASAGMPTHFIGPTAKAASLLAAGRAATTGLVSATVAALAGGGSKSIWSPKLVVAASVLALATVTTALARRPAAGRGEEQPAARGRVRSPKGQAEQGVGGRTSPIRRETTTVDTEPDYRGRWRATRFLIDGRPDPAEAVERLELVLGERTYRFDGVPRSGPRGKGSGAGRLIVDTAARPHRIDLIPASGPFEGLTHAGIFEVEGDRLRLCFAMPTKPRPAEFATRPNSGIYLAEFRRGAADGAAGDADRLEKAIGRALAALGGEAKLRSLRSFTETLRETRAFGRATTTKHFVQLPDKYRCEIRNPGDDRTLICILTGNGMRRLYRKPDGTAAEVVFGGLEHPVEYWLDALEFFGPRAALRLTDDEHRRTWLGESRLGDRPAWGIRVRKEAPRVTVDLSLSFDEQTGLLLREVTATGTASTYRDYEEFGGIPVARKATRSLDKGKETIEVEVVEFRAVDGFDPALFRAP